MLIVPMEIYEYDSVLVCDLSLTVVKSGIDG